MGKFPLADKDLLSRVICKKCKTRNPKKAVLCIKCKYPNMRPKRMRKKEGKSGK